jgi:Spy/CpxP family protein refolding chaperone
VKRLIAISALSCAGLVAQVPGMFPWWDSPIARDLNLSAEQNGKIRETVREYRSRLIQLRATLEASEGELGDLMNDDPVDSAKTTAAFEKVIAARSELTRAVSQMSLKLRLILTAEQWRELQRRQPRPNPGGRGPGPPNRPPDRPRPPNPPPNQPDL